MTAAVSTANQLLLENNASLNQSAVILEQPSSASLLLTHQSAPPPFPPLPASLRGSRLNQDFLQKYRPLKQIGSGGFGFVCTTLRLKDGLLFATKFIDKSKAISGFANDDQLGRVPLEVYILKNVIFIIFFWDFFWVYWK
jgi:hypothetical protein